MNKHLLGVDIDTTEKMDGQWYKITQPLMESSCETLRTKILSKIETKVNSQLDLEHHLRTTNPPTKLQHTISSNCSIFDFPLFENGSTKR